MKRAQEATDPNTVKVLYSRPNLPERYQFDLPATYEEAKTLFSSTNLPASYLSSFMSACDRARGVNRNSAASWCRRQIREFMTPGE